ncbi:TetR/AcrR family transcriptional regulator, partial [Rhizobium ruizarguesonis]
PERTRAAILDAATREFAENGMGGALVDAIAERAGTNKRMLYHYFGDKEQLYQTKKPGTSITGEFLGWGDYWTRLATQVAGRN